MHVGPNTPRPVGRCPRCHLAGSCFPLSAVLGGNTHLTHLLSMGFWIARTIPLCSEHMGAFLVGGDWRGRRACVCQFPKALFQHASHCRAERHDCSLSLSIPGIPVFLFPLFWWVRRALRGGAPGTSLMADEADHLRVHCPPQSAHFLLGCLSFSYWLAGAF